MPDQIQTVCDECRAVRKTARTVKGLERLPKGWHRIETDGKWPEDRPRPETAAAAFIRTYCDKCWSKRYVLRAIAIPVATALDATWPELWAEVRSSWKLTTQASNWMITELARRDITRTSDMAKLPKPEPVSLYRDATQRFPELPPQTIIAIEHAIQGKYRAKRQERIWQCSTSLPAFRYPVPVPIYSQSWSARLENGQPIVSLRLGNKDRENGKGRYTLRLRSGPEFRRQLVRFKEIARGEAPSGEAVLYEKNRALMCKMVAWFPISQAPADTNGRMLPVHSAVDSLLIAVNPEDERLWTYNADHLRRWSAEHARLVNRLAEDSKFENRPVPAFSDRRSNAARKYRDRMDSAIHQISAQLVSYASRRRFTGIRYDDREKAFCKQFPWYQMRQSIAYKAEESGLQFEVVAEQSGDVEVAAEQIREVVAEQSKETEVATENIGDAADRGDE